jgi:hypothetical protein
MAPVNPTTIRSALKATTFSFARYISRFGDRVVRSVQHHTYGVEQLRQHCGLDHRSNPASYGAEQLCKTGKRPCGLNMTQRVR